MEFCSMTGLPCIPGCTRQTCAGMHVSLDQWPTAPDAPPTVAGQITDERIAEWLAYEGDLSLHDAVAPSLLRAALTELQHRREAEAGAKPEAWAREMDINGLPDIHWEVWGVDNKSPPLVFGGGVDGWKYRKGMLNADEGSREFVVGQLSVQIVEWYAEDHPIRAALLSFTFRAALKDTTHGP